MSCK